MTAFNTPYKYGKQTKNQIDAISTSQLEVGDNVYNTDIEKAEFWTGNTWINGDCVEAYNVSTTALVTGHIVCIHGGTNYPPGAGIIPPSVIYVTHGGENTPTGSTNIGVIYRGGPVGSKVCVACMGVYKVLFVSGATGIDRQFICSASPSQYGEAISSGTKLSVPGTNAAMGVIMETFAVLPLDRLVNVWISLDGY